MANKIGNHVVILIDDKGGEEEVIRCNHPAILNGCIEWSDKHGQRYARSVSKYHEVSYRKGDS